MPQLLALVLIFALSSVAAAQFDPPPVSSPAGPTKLDGCQVIARVDNQVILASDVMWEANIIINDNLHQIPPDQIEQTRDMLMRKQLMGLLDTKLIYADFRRKAQQADMNAIRNQLEEPFYNGGRSGNAPGSVPSLMKVLQADSVQQLEQKLLEIGTTLADRKEAYVEKAIAQTWVQEQISVDRPTYTTLLDYYQAHLDDYAYPTQARWEELTVRFENHPTKQAAIQKLAEAGNLVWQRVQQNPASTEPLFADVAAKYSEAYNAQEGGMNDWTTQGALRDDALDRALFTLPVGSLSPMIETDTACHIVRVVERREAGVKPFGELQDEIRDQLMNNEFRSKTEAMIDKLRRETRIWTIYTGDTTAEAFLAPPPGAPQRY